MEEVIRRNWVSRAQSVALSAPSQPEEGLCGPVAQVLSARGLHDEQEIRDFLGARLSSLPDPFLLLGMRAAVDRLRQAIRAGERILVHGDYDVDGMSGTALLVETLRAFGGEVDFHIPLRLVEGYGLSGTALEKAADDGCRVVLSVDCGISAAEEARLAHSLGLDLIITDHHQPPAELPEAVALVNPHLPECPFPDKNLAGVGVAFFLLVALRSCLREDGWFAGRQEPDLRLALDLVALGTIADVVPLQGVNRMLVRVGLDLLETGRRPGIEALIRVAKVERVTCGAVGFRLAPRLNAAGRLEDAADGVRLLMSTDAAEAERLAGLLDKHNSRRQQIEEQTLQQALERLEAEPESARSIVLADERWHEGVIGIVASRLIDRFHRPTVLIALDGDRGKGSARSISGFHLYRALSSCGEELLGFGGHEAAAGLSIDRNRVEPFALAFEEVVQKVLDEDDLVPRLYHDGEILLEELGMPETRQLGQLAPFGAGNPEPSFVARGVTLVQKKVVGGRHLKFTACQGGYSLPGIAFGMGGRLGELDGEVDLLFSADVNIWRGTSSVQLKVKDIRPAAG